MDSLTTILAGIIVVALPFALYFRLVIRARRKQELDEIKRLATERSRLLDELHSRLDNLDKQDSRRASKASEETIFSAAFLQGTLLSYHHANWMDIAAKRYFDVQAIQDPEWIRHAGLYEVSMSEHFGRRRVDKRKSGRQPRSLTPQPL